MTLESKPEPKEEAITNDPEVISKDDAKNIMATQEFEEFFGKTSRLVLRGMYSDNDDILGSFSRMQMDEESNIVQRGEKLVEVCTFMQDNPVNRAITTLEWSPNHEELFLCGYSKAEN